MKYPIGIQDFESIRNDDFVYVDKTDLIYKMTSQKGTYFLSRPQRFGKSLTVSILENYFLGKKELFSGLAISKLEKDWKTYPVLRIDMSGIVYDKPDSIDTAFSPILNRYESLYGSNSSELTTAQRLRGVIERAAIKTDMPAVILIDEYDKPLLSALDNSDLYEAYRQELSSIYSCLKSEDKYIRFAFITGVSRFSHVSIFSDLNNLVDISLDRNFSTLCGITDEEIDKYFHNSIENVAKTNNLSYLELREQLRQKYDGYHFSNRSVGVYNPFSLLSCFYFEQTGNFWATSGTPDFLVNLIKEQNIDISTLNGEVYASDEDLTVIGANEVNVASIMFQSGYLTIKDYDRDTSIYRLGFPNEEVRRSFSNFLIPYYTTTNRSELPRLTLDLVNAVKQGDPDKFLSNEQVLLAGIPKDVNEPKRLEQAYRDLLVLTFRILGFRVTPENALSGGRSDVVLETPKYIYIFEFKLDGNGSADDALQQIDNKHYSDPYTNDARKLFKIGVAFDNKIKNIKNWIVK